MPLTEPQQPPPKRRAFLWQALIGLGISAVASVIFYGPGHSVDLSNPTWHQSNTLKYGQEENLLITGSLATFVSPRQSGSDVFQENLRLIVQDLTGKNVTLDEYTQTYINEIKLFSQMPKLLNKATPIWQIDQLVNL